MSQDYWLGLATGIVVWFIVNNFVLPDPWSTWLGLRRNFPTVLMPFGVALALVAVINLIYGSGWALIQAFNLVHFAPWVWWTLASGVAIILIYTIARRLMNRPWLPWR